MGSSLTKDDDLLSTSSNDKLDHILSKSRIDNNEKNVAKGKEFEKLTKIFLETNSIYQTRFTKVQFWEDWSRSDKGSGRPDGGIDLVATAFDGTLTAIQCKCYKSDHAIAYDDVTHLVTEYNNHKKYNFDRMVLVHTSDRINEKANNTILENRIQVIDKENLNQIDWSNYPNKLKSHKPNEMYPHQEKACNDTITGLKKNDRGKLIMACGTGKTLTSLRVVEDYLKGKGIVLYLVPSITLISQTMIEWSDNRKMSQKYLAVCSDKSVKKKDEEGNITELESDVSTDVNDLYLKIKTREKDKQLAIFCTYNSIQVVADAINKLKTKIDLCFCDEAHRTAGRQHDEIEKISYYHKVHHDHIIPIEKRIYMTATPRVFSDTLTAKAAEEDKIIYNMNNEETFGPEFHNLTFRSAVDQEILCDYNVLVAVFPESIMDLELQKNAPFEVPKGDEGLLAIGRLTRMAAVWSGIINPKNKKVIEKKDMLQRVIVFNNTINSSKDFKNDRVYNIDDEKIISLGFGTIVENVKKRTKKGLNQTVSVRHVDGSDSSSNRKKELKWLADSTNNTTQCRLLTNARCLSEGVDVPDLDGIVFMEPRASMIDVVQSVGRVMRKPICKKCKSKKCLDPIAHNIKQRGYVILPVGIPVGEDADKLMKDSKSWKNVWQVISALKSHDPDLKIKLNQLSLRSDEYHGITDTISVVDFDFDSLPQDEKDKLLRVLYDGIKTKLVQKFGSVKYYENYSKDLGKVARDIEERIKERIKTNVNTDGEIISLHNGLKQMINGSVTKNDTIKVVAQHKVLSSVFDTLFDKEFTSHNPMSKILDGVISRIGFDEELYDFKPFYEQVKKESDGIDNIIQKQNLIKKVYENFFKGVDKKETDKHGVTYTPIEVIDFIINSTEYFLKKHFNTRFNDREVKVFDPFTGAGSFIVRLLQSGLIDTNLRAKYANDIFANEILLLAYYIASVNIETTYAMLPSTKKIKSFTNLNYTDTLKHDPRYRQDVEYRKDYEKFGQDYKEIDESIKRTKFSHVHVIMGNPPYSAGQKNANDENPNVKYEKLDKSIEQTYVQKVNVTNKNSLYDSYIRSIRWATDRIGESGIISFVTNGGFLKSESGAGVRACLEAEFNEIWCFDLRGNLRTNGETMKKEGGNIFNVMVPISIIFLIKNLKKKDCIIHYKNIGNYLNKNMKLDIIKKAKSIQGIKDWKIIKPDKHYDWIDKRNDSFYQYDIMGNKETKAGKNENSIFKIYSNGTATNRDAWVYNSSKEILSKNMKIHIDYCNNQNLDNPQINSKKGKWSSSLTDRLKKYKLKFIEKDIRIGLYRPFFKQYIYFNKIFIHRMSLLPKIFPNYNTKNIVICIPINFTGSFTTFITNVIPDLHVIAANQCFPLYTYSEKFNNNSRSNNITDFILKEYHKYYKDKTILKEDIFYYIYGILHHDGYRKKFINSLTKDFPHIPMALDFKTFSNIGKKLADLHLIFDTCKRYNLGKPMNKFGKYESLKFKKKKVDNEKTVLQINKIDVFSNIPDIKYQVNGKTPLEWIIDRYKIKIYEDSGLINDSCKDIDIIPIIERAIYVGVESDRLISQLPKEFEPKDWKPKKIGLDAHMNTPSQTQIG